MLMFHNDAFRVLDFKDGEEGETKHNNINKNGTITITKNNIKQETHAKCLDDSEVYSDVKNNDIIKSANKWMELEKVILSEVTQTQTDKYEDENLWIASRLIWFDQPRPPDSSQTAPVKIEQSS
ncbi:hypothetical protein STEG23_009781 [Scotinomys teguina]